MEKYNNKFITWQQLVVQNHPPVIQDNDEEVDLLDAEPARASIEPRLGAVEIEQAREIVNPDPLPNPAVEPKKSNKKK